MSWLHVIWDVEYDPRGNVQHIADNDLVPADVTRVLRSPEAKGTSCSGGMPCVFGHTEDGRYIIVIYEEIDNDTVYPITAYEIDHPGN